MGDISESEVALLVLGIYVGLGLFFIILAPKLQLPAMVAGDNGLERLKLLNELRRTVIQIVGGVGVAIGLFITWRTLSANDDAKQTDRYSTLIQSLNGDSPSARYTAISELIAIASSNPDLRDPICDALCFWIRHQHEPVSLDRTIELESALHLVLGTYDKNAEIVQTPRANTVILANADLSGLCIPGANFSNCDLRGVNLANSDFHYSDFRDAHLEGANLTSTKLYYASTSGIKFSAGTIFQSTDFQGDDLSGADCRSAFFRNVSLYDTTLVGTDFTGADLSTVVSAKRSELEKAKLDQCTLPQSYRSEEGD